MIGAIVWCVLSLAAGFLMIGCVVTYLVHLVDNWKDGGSDDR